MNQELSKENGENSGASPILARSLRLRHFRNYGELDLELTPGFTIIAGPNAQGKTNLLEALYLLATTRLLRGQRDAEAIEDNRAEATVSAELDPFGTKIGIRLERGVRKRASLNEMNLPRASDLLGRLPCVCISTADMEIVRSDPSARRLFLDLELSALYPAYLRHFSDYKRALEQRNSLLRAAREQVIPAEVFEPWEDTLATHGSAMRAMRLTYIRELAATAMPRHAELGGGELLALDYEVRDTGEDAITTLAALANGRAGDVARGGTSVGPHRDDLAISVGSRDARTFGSQGQQRTAVLALKFGSMAIAQRVHGAPPLLLLDDILSDLDVMRRTALTELVVRHAAQAVLTCTEASAAGHAILDQAQVFSVCAGQVRPA